MGRLRKNQKATVKMGESPYFLNHLTQPEALNQYVNNSQKLYLEIGMGKGNFIFHHALNNLEINYLGVEKFDTVIWKALHKYQQHDFLSNLKVMSTDASELSTIIPHHSVDHLYLNFSDPWPKSRHAKRRLTHPSFLKIYFQILKPEGLIEFKTDNDSLFNWTLNEVLLADRDKYEIVYWTNDLYNNLTHPYNQYNVPTEYETKFHQQGKNINKVIFKIKYM